MLDPDSDTVAIFAMTGPSSGGKTSALWGRSEQPGIEADPGLLVRLTDHLFDVKAYQPDRFHFVLQVLEVMGVDKPGFKPELKAME